MTQVQPLSKWQTHPTYKDSGIEWLGEIPAHWEVKRLKEHVILINGYPFDSELFSKFNGIPLIRIRDLMAGKTETFYSGSQVEEALVFDGDILIGMDGDFNICWWQGGQALLNQRLCCIRPKDSIDQRYIYYLLRLPLKIINDLTWFTTVKHLSSSQVLAIRFSFPPLSEQRAIAAFLDRETTRINALIDSKERLIELLREKRTALISSAVTKGLDPTVTMKDSGVEWIGEIPAHWGVKRLKFCLHSIEQGWSPSCENRIAEQNEWGVLKVGCVNGITFNPEENKALPTEIQPIPELEIKTGDILISRANTRELLGSASVVGQVRSRLLLCDKLYRLKIQQESLNAAFFVLSMASSSVRFQLERDATGASNSMQNISQSTILNLIMPLPKRQEQQAVAAYLDRETAKIDALISRIGEGIEKLQEYSTALIAAAVTGKIDVRGEMGNHED